MTDSSDSALLITSQSRHMHIGVSLLLRRAVRQAPHIGSQHVHLAFTKEILVRRHDVVAALADGFHDGLKTAAIEPDLVGQIGRTQGRITFPLLAQRQAALAVLEASTLPAVLFSSPVITQTAVFPGYYSRGPAGQTVH